MCANYEIYYCVVVCAPYFDNISMTGYPDDDGNVQLKLWQILANRAGKYI